jgi:anti-sigma regulatory factor (Ser/Thr protein kinase)
MSAQPVLLGSLTITGRPENVSATRAFVRRTLGADHACTDSAVLLASEMCANSIQHSQSGDGGEITISVIAVPGGIRVEVADQGGPSVPALRPAGLGQPGTAESGRGLQMVDALAARWDYAQDATGTVTWFELAVPVIP